MVNNPVFATLNEAFLSTPTISMRPCPEEKLQGFSEATRYSIPDIKKPSVGGKSATQFTLHHELLTRAKSQCRLSRYPMKRGDW